MHHHHHRFAGSPGRSWRRIGPGLSLALILFVPAAPRPAQADVLPILSLQETHLFVLERAEDAIRVQERAARDEESIASREEGDAKSALEREKAQIEIVKKDIEAIKARIDAAKQAKDEGARLEFEKQKKIQEIELKLAEKRKEMRSPTRRRARTRALPWRPPAPASRSCGPAVSPSWHCWRRRTSCRPRSPRRRRRCARWSDRCCRRTGMRRGGPRARRSGGSTCSASESRLWRRNSRP